MYLPAQGGTSLNKNYLPTGKDVTEFNPQLQHFDYVCGQVMKENRLLRFVVIISVLSSFGTNKLKAVLEKLASKS